jgi:predicted enzyme related to lactoylglutathione lyase
MKVEGMHLAWIVVKDLAKALEFYTETVGLTLRSHQMEHGWAELSGPNGSLLGIAQEGPCMEQTAGINAVMTVTVANIDAAIKHFLEKGAKLIGSVIEVPGHVKMQTFVDVDGNTLQLVEQLDGH